MTYCLGANFYPAPPSVAPLVARASLSRLVPRKSVNWFSVRKADGDPLGNDQLSCCCQAADYRRIEIDRAVLGDEWQPTEELVVRRYALTTDYNQATGANDNGTATDEDMSQWVSKGIWINSQTLHIPHWCSVDPLNSDHVALAIDRTGPVLLTLALPRCWEDLSRWAQAPGQGTDWQTGAGSHRVLAGAYESVGGALKVRTWGQDVELHPGWITRYCQAVDAVLSLAWFAAQPELALPGLQWSELAQDMNALAA
jgi:hypothetical protein